MSQELQRILDFGAGALSLCVVLYLWMRFWDWVEAAGRKSRSGKKQPEMCCPSCAGAVTRFDDAMVRCLVCGRRTDYYEAIKAAER